MKALLVLLATLFLAACLGAGLAQSPAPTVTIQSPDTMVAGRTYRPRAVVRNAGHHPVRYEWLTKEIFGRTEHRDAQRCLFTPRTPLESPWHPHHAELLVRVKVGQLEVWGTKAVYIREGKGR